MPTCQNCGHKWSWKQTFKRSFVLSDGMTCPYCEEKQYITASARKRSTLMVFIAPVIMFFNIFLALHTFF